MAEQNITGGGDSATNTTTVTSGRGSVSGANDLSTANTKDAKLESTTAKPAATADQPLAADALPLPYPHQAYAGAVKEGVVYRDLIDEVYKEHEHELEKGSGNVYEPTPEMIAARADAQLRLAEELRASLKAQRVMQSAPQQEGSIKIRLSQDHTHNGIPYKKGDEIMVDENSANFIEAAKAGKRTDGNDK